MEIIEDFETYKTQKTNLTEILNDQTSSHANIIFDSAINLNLRQ